MSRRSFLKDISIATTLLMSGRSSCYSINADQQSIDYSLYDGSKEDCNHSIVDVMESDQFYDLIFRELIGIEGGYRCYCGKGEKEVNFGITKRYYPNEDIKNLKIERAKYIYYRDYYDERGIKDIPDKDVLPVVFYNAVNQGQKRSVSQLQKVIGTRQDGFFGTNSIKAFLEMKSEVGVGKIIDNFCILIGERYNNVISRNADLKDFKSGWGNRISGYKIETPGFL